MNPDRIAGIIIPNFAVEVCLKEYPQLADQPLALVAVAKETTPIYAVNQKAADEGVAPNMTVAQAKTRCPGLVLKERISEKEAVESDRLFNGLLSVSPLVEEGAGGCFFLDACGLGRLYKNEEGLAKTIIARLKSLCYPVKAGIGKNKLVAHIAADISPLDSFTIVPENSEQKLLSDLSIDRLPVAVDIRENLRDLGLKTIGQVAAFPANEMQNRFGEEGKILSRLARGDDVGFFLPVLPPVRLSKRISLDYSLAADPEVISLVENGVKEIFDGFKSAARGCDSILITLHLESHEKQTLRLSVKQPSASLHPFIRQLKTSLSGLRLTSGITDITITIPRITPLFASQLELAKLSNAACPIRRHDEHIRQTLDKMSLYLPKINNAVLPDQGFNLDPVNSKEKPAASGREGENPTIGCRLPGQPHKAWRPPYSLHPVAGLRLQQPPRETSIVTRDGRLLTIRLSRTASDIVRQSGPWVLSGNWWGNGFDRLYYEVQTADQRLFLLFFDRQKSCWYLQGIFD